MKEVVNAYRTHKLTVDTFVKTLVKNLPVDYIANKSVILGKSKFIQLMYGVDESFRQKTPIFEKDKEDAGALGSDKSIYFSKLSLDEDNIYISNPYIHYKTGKASVSVVHKIDDTYYVFDINLMELLEKLELIEYNGAYEKMKRMIYMLKVDDGDQQ